MVVVMLCGDGMNGGECGVGMFHKGGGKKMGVTAEVMANWWATHGNVF